MTYKYKSPVGIMLIRPLSGRWGLYIGENLYGSYHSPAAAADDVYTHTTGCDEWDKQDGEIDEGPTDLSDWEQHL